jgi:predicted homoserine dehydrogenase-like protein
MGSPVRVGVIGAGIFGSMVLSQLQEVKGMHLVGVADRDPERAHAALRRTGWPEPRTQALSLEEAHAKGTTAVVEDALTLATSEHIDVLVEATGSPTAAVEHALAAIEAGRHVVNVTVEADALVGPIVAQRAQAAGVVYALAYGDQPALICELVDWARLSGFRVVSAGKGTKYLPTYHASTPDTVWDHWGIDQQHAETHGLNATMFNSFLDGTKSAIEMAAVADATGLVPQDDGLQFPPAGEQDLASVCIPEADGGVLSQSGTVEVVSSLHRDGSEVERDLRWGVYVVFEAPSDYVAERFGEYGLTTDPSGRFASLWRPYHLIGLELVPSIARAALLGQATGTPSSFLADVVAVAKRDLKAGEKLDGEGGYSVWGALRPAQASVEGRKLPIGLAHDVVLSRDVAIGETLTRDDVVLDYSAQVIALREELEAPLRH